MESITLTMAGREASHELHQLEDPEIKRERRKGTLSGKILTSFYYYTSNLARMLLTSILQNRYTISASTHHPPPYNTNTTKSSTGWLLPVSPVSALLSPPI
jgi:hypothetical protein